MRQMVVDPDWVERLRDAAGAVDLVTPDGIKLGTFYPKQPTLAEILADCPYSEEELNQMAEEARQSGAGRELSAILGDLEAQWPSQ